MQAEAWLRRLLETQVRAWLTFCHFNVKAVLGTRSSTEEECLGVASVSTRA